MTKPEGNGKSVEPLPLHRIARWPYSLHKKATKDKNMAQKGTCIVFLKMCTNDGYRSIRSSWANACASDEPRVAKADGPLFDFLPESDDVRVFCQTFFKVFQFLTLCRLYLQGDLAATIEELSDLLELLSS